MLRALAIGLLLVTPAAAAEDPLDLFALAIGGVRDGVAGQLSGAGPIQRMAPGVYRGTPVDGTEFSLTVTLHAPCVFDSAIGPDGSVPHVVRIDLNRATGITIAQLQGARFRVTIDGPEGLAQTQFRDGWLNVLNVTEYESSVPLVDLQAAAIALREACPGA